MRVLIGMLVELKLYPIFGWEEMEINEKVGECFPCLTG